jgi:cytochrome P450
MAEKAPTIPVSPARAFRETSGLPGPRSPAAAQTLAWVRRPLQLMESCRRRYGDAFVLRVMPDGPWLMLADPDAIAEVFRGDPTVMMAGEANAVVEPVTGPNSVLLLDGAHHLRQRKLLLPPFHGERMRAYEALIEDVTERHLAGWTEEPRAVRPLMQAITLEVIGRAVFGVGEPARLEPLLDGLRRMLEWITDPRRLVLLVLAGPERMKSSRRLGFRSVMEVVDRRVREEIRRRRADPNLADNDDVMSLLLQAKDESGEPMSEDEIRDELMTLLGAGHETTATALSWSLLELSRNPHARSGLASQDGAYADAVVQETLRLRPVVPIVVRRLSSPARVAGYELPAGIQLAPCIPLVHRRPELYPEPDRFRPERFLDTAPQTYGWIPFGGGIRRCIGAAFASMEMRVVLQVVVRQRRIRPSPGKPEGVARRGVTLSPARGGEVVLSRR